MNKTCEGCIYNQEFTGICLNKEGICVDHDKYKPIIGLDCKDCKHNGGDYSAWCFDIVGKCLNHEKFEPKKLETNKTEIKHDGIITRVRKYS